jgi:thymidine kinase
MRTVVYTAEIDDRFGAGKVSSRIGLSSPARCIIHRPRYLTILRRSTS